MEELLVVILPRPIYKSRSQDPWSFTSRHSEEEDDDDMGAKLLLPSVPMYKISRG
jgi:hypothetical protein